MPRIADACATVLKALFDGSLPIDEPAVPQFSEPTYDNFLSLEQFLEQLFGRRIDILTPAGVDSIRVPEISEDIKRTLVHV